MKEDESIQYNFKHIKQMKGEEENTKGNENSKVEKKLVTCKNN